MQPIFGLAEDISKKIILKPAQQYLGIGRTDKDKLQVAAKRWRQQTRFQKLTTAISLKSEIFFKNH